MNLTIDQSGSIPIARLAGEWRATDDQEYQDDLHPLVAQAGSKLIIDLSELSMIDSSGLAALISVVTHARLSGARVVLVRPTPFVSGVFETTNLDGWFEVCPDTKQAGELLGSA
ncbi:MAG: STAS domain-containing protein [bacterium]|nr:STAS domain-containing protein [bacterium]